MAEGSARTKKKLFKTNSKKRAVANKKYKDTVFQKLSDLYMPEESGNIGRRSQRSIGVEIIERFLIKS